MERPSGIYVPERTEATFLGVLAIPLPVEISTPVRISSFMAANASRQNPRIPAVTITLDAASVICQSNGRFAGSVACAPPGLLHQMATFGSVIMVVARQL